jgi:hypothetical protein
MLINELVLYSGWLAKYLAVLFYNISLLSGTPELGTKFQNFAFGFKQLISLLLGLCGLYRVDPLVKTVR